MATGNKISELTQLASNAVDFDNDVLPISQSTSDSKKITVAHLPFMTGAIDGGDRRGGFVPEYFIGGTGVTRFTDVGVNMTGFTNAATNFQGSPVVAPNTGFIVTVAPTSGIISANGQTNAILGSRKDVQKVGIMTNTPASSLHVGGASHTGLAGSKHIGYRTGATAKVQALNVDDKFRVTPEGHIYTTLGDVISGGASTETNLHQAYKTGEANNFGSFGKQIRSNVNYPRGISQSFNEVNSAPGYLTAYNAEVLSAIPRYEVSSSTRGMLVKDRIILTGIITSGDFAKPANAMSSIYGIRHPGFALTNLGLGPKVIYESKSNVTYFIKSATIMINYKGFTDASGDGIYAYPRRGSISLGGHTMFPSGFSGDPSVFANYSTFATGLTGSSNGWNHRTPPRPRASGAMGDIIFGVGVNTSINGVHAPSWGPQARFSNTIFSRLAGNSPHKIIVDKDAIPTADKGVVGRKIAWWTSNQHMRETALKGSTISYTLEVETYNEGGGHFQTSSQTNMFVSL